MSFVWLSPSPAARLAIRAIGLYQAHISPRKGFVCAHRILHGGASCSQFARAEIEKRGLIAGLRAMPVRFRACREASLLLAFSQGEDEPAAADDSRATSRHTCHCGGGEEACAELGCEAAGAVFEAVACDATCAGCI